MTRVILSIPVLSRVSLEERKICRELSKINSPYNIDKRARISVRDFDMALEGMNDVLGYPQSRPYRSRHLTLRLLEFVIYQSEVLNKQRYDGLDLPHDGGYIPYICDSSYGRNSCSSLCVDGGLIGGGSVVAGAGIH